MDPGRSDPDGAADDAGLEPPSDGGGVGVGGLFGALVGFGVAVGLGVGFGVGAGVALGGAVIVMEPASIASLNFRVSAAWNPTVCVPTRSVVDQWRTTPAFHVEPVPVIA